MAEVNQEQPRTSASLPEDLETPDKPNIKKPRRFFPIVIGLIGILLVGGLLGYINLTTDKERATKQSTKVYQGKIVVGYNTWPGYLALYLARDKGYFKQAGLNVELRNFANFAAIAQAYKSGELQAKASLTLDAVNDAYEGINHKVIIATDYSHGADGIITKANIKDLVQLKGKKIAVEKGSIGEFFLLYALERYKMNITDITIVNVDAEHAALELQKGTVDAAVTFEPYLSQTMEAVKGNKIFSSANAPGIITDIVAFKSDFIQQYPETVQLFVNAYFEGIRFWKEHPQEAAELVAAELKVSPNEVANQVSGITILDQSDNVRAHDFGSNTESLYGNMRHINKFVLSQRGSDTNSIDTDTLINSQFVKNVSGTN